MLPQIRIKQKIHLIYHSFNCMKDMITIVEKYLVSKVRACTRHKLNRINIDKALGQNIIDDSFILDDINWLV